tara:strand:- start:192 stop:713 length:522 start_codon:yes stop_codon:yes gene_type:complete
LKLIHKKQHREVYEDGNYIVKKTTSDAFDFDMYRRFQLDNPWCVKVHSFEDGVIVMDKVLGDSWWRYVRRSTPTQLWNICFTFRNETVKSFFDFMGSTYIEDANQLVFFNADATEGNLIIQGDKPMFIDPDGFCRQSWDIFILKVLEHNNHWFNLYVHYAHRNTNKDFKFFTN